MLHPQAPFYAVKGGATDSMWSIVMVVLILGVIATLAILAQSNGWLP